MASRRLHSTEAQIESERRLTGLEERQESFEHNFEGHARRVADQFEQLNQRIERGFTETSRALDILERERRPDWKLYLGVIGVCFTLVTALGGLALAPAYIRIGSVERHTHKIETVMQDAVDRLDTNLQREMRQLDETRDARAEAIKDTIMREIDRSQSEDHRIFNTFEDRIKEVEKGLRDAQREDAQRSTINRERIRCLERPTFNETPHNGG